MHQHIEPNLKGRDFIVGDIHGAYKLLRKEMTRNGFNETTDRLFSVGDIIDRGPDSKRCLSLLNEPWFHMVLGNHEQMMIDFIVSGQGYNWLTEYGGWARKIRQDDLNTYIKQLAKLPISLTLDCSDFSVGICHAEPEGDDWIACRDNPQSRNAMMWGRTVLRKRPETKLSGVNISIHGHTPLETPKWVGNRYFMDTGAWYSKNLTFRNIADIHAEHQAAESLFSK